MTAIEFQNVTFAYHGKCVIDRANFKVEGPSCIGVVGPNGGGKTTLLNLVLGLIKPQVGSILVFGKDPKFVRTRIGYVPQVLQFDSGFPLTTTELVLGGLATELNMFGRYPKSAFTKVNEVLDKTGLAEKASSPFSELSGGQKQRALIARAMVSRPDILLLDEPTANIDIQSQKYMKTLIQDLKQSCAILLVTHELPGMMDVVDRLLVVNQEVEDLQKDQLCNHITYGVFHQPKGGLSS